MRVCLVRERARRSKRVSEYSLDDDDIGDGFGSGHKNDDLLKHKGKAIDSLSAKDHVILLDDELDDEGQLGAADTLQHFGGGLAGRSGALKDNHYGPSSENSNLLQQYSDRKTELDDLIARRKLQKAERVKNQKSAS